jgi:acyl dehydratase
VFVGDTLFAESEVTGLRESASNPDVGIVQIRTRGVNQDGVVVIEYRRTFMAYRRGAAAALDAFPTVSADWTV